jgi:hypothetical protein
MGGFGASGGGDVISFNYTSLIAFGQSGLAFRAMKVL